MEMKPDMVARAVLGRDDGGPAYDRGSGNQKQGQIQGQIVSGLDTSYFEDLNSSKD